MAIDVGPVVSSAAGSPWALELEEQMAALTALTDCYLTWVEILAEKSPEEMAPLGPEALLAIRQDLSRPPSLHDLAHGQVSSMPILTAMRDEISAESPPTRRLA